MYPIRYASEYITVEDYQVSSISSSASIRVTPRLINVHNGHTKMETLMRRLRYLYSKNVDMVVWLISVGLGVLFSETR